MYAGNVGVIGIARHKPHLRFPQRLRQSTHLRCSLRGFQVVTEEDAEERQHCYSRDSAGKMIHLQGGSK